MPRYAVHLAYKGTTYSGWQIQENANTVQEELQKAFSLNLGEPINLMGCGRTDAGVHASYYIAHFDHSAEIPLNLVHRLNSYLSNDILVHSVMKVHDDFHARFDATLRTYKYLLDFQPSLYLEGAYYHCPYGRQVDASLMQRAADILPRYRSFFPFCKSKVEVDHYKCNIKLSRWEQVSESRWIYTVQANRFLRGMVRLIVGMTINVSRGRMELNDVETALDKQQRLKYPWSAPAEGLYLYDVQYPDPLTTRESASPLFFPI